MTHTRPAASSSPRPTSARRRLTLIGIALFLVLVALFIFSRHLFPTGFLRDAVASQAQALGVDVTFADTHLSLLPLPHLVIAELQISVPEVVSGKVAETRVYPRWRRLLSGSLDIAGLRLRAPVIAVALPAAQEVKATAVSFQDLPALAVEQLERAWGRLPQRLHGMQVDVDSGQIELAGDGDSLATITDLAGRLSLAASDLTLRASCRSDLWDHLEVDATFDPARSAGTSRIFASNLRLAPLLQHLPAGAVELKEAEPATLELAVALQSAQTMQANLQATLPALALGRAGASASLRELQLQTSMLVEAGDATWTLSHLEAAQPLLQVSGVVSIDAAGHASADLEGTQLDVASIRETAIRLYGDDKTVAAIFDVLRAGTVESIQFVSRAASLGDLLDPENFSLEGKLAGGHIQVREPRLDLDQVTGHARIHRGILHGTQARGRMGSTNAEQGHLRVALGDAEAPFRLDARVRADLSELPDTLRSVVKDASVLAHLRRLRGIEGSAEGRLLLTERPEGLDIRVELTEFEAAGGYGELQQPLQLRGGRLTYETTGIVFLDLAARHGDSSVEKLDGRIDWRRQAHLTLTAGPATIDLGDLHAVLSAFDLHSHLGVSPLAGTVHLDAVHFEGPLWSSQAWKLDLQGTAADAALQIPAPLGRTTVSGTLAITEAVSSLTDGTARFSDAQIGGSVQIGGYLTGSFSLRGTVSGQIGPEAGRRLLAAADLPAQAELRGPVALSRGRLVLHPHGVTSVSGTVAMSGARTVSFDVDSSPERVEVRTLSVRDDQSDATFALTADASRFDLSFRGRLTKQTVDALLRDNHYLDGVVEGDFELRHLRGQPAASSLRGELSGRSLHLLGLGSEVTIDAFGIRGDGRTATIESKGTVAGVQGTLGGTARITTDDLAVDLDLTTSAVDWDQIDALLPHVMPRRSTGSHPVRYPPLRATLRVSCEAFSMGRFTWAPVRATVDVVPGATLITVTEAEVCGIQTPGTLEVGPYGVELLFAPAAHQQEAVSSFGCLSGSPAVVEGTFDLEGNIGGRGAAGALLQSLHGRLQVSARDGRILHSGFADRLFRVLNTSEVFLGHLPHPDREGLVYQSIDITLALERERLEIKEAVLRASMLALVATGSIDLRDRTLDLTLLASPFGMAVPLVQRLPVIRDVLGPSLVSIPIRASGSVDAPTFVPLSPSAVASEVLGIVGRTLNVPIRLIQPLLPGATDQ